MAKLPMRKQGVVATFARGLWDAEGVDGQRLHQEQSGGSTADKQDTIDALRIESLLRARAVRGDLIRRRRS